MVIEMELIIGRRIRELRKIQHLNITKLAKAANISPGLLSKIENAKVSSPIATYAKIATALGVKFGDLVTGDSDLSCLVMRNNESNQNDYDVNPSTTNGYFLKPLGSSWPNKNCKAFLLTYDPLANESNRPNHTNDGDEFVYVLEGKVDFFHGKKQYLLREGDSIFIDARIPHGGRAHDKKKATVLFIYIRK